MSRIQALGNTRDILIKMSEGNPGAINVLMQLLEKAELIDPDDFLGSISSILHLDTLEIYGSNIWVLYKDICREEISKLVALLRSYQLGFISPNLIVKASDDRLNGKELIDIDYLYAKVKEQLPNFDNYESN